MRLARRRLLLAPLALLGAALLPRRTVAADAHAPIIAVIDRNFPGLRADRDGLDAFAADLLALRPAVARHPGYESYLSWSWLQDLGLLRRLVPGAITGDIDAFEGTVVTSFLLSTDFFDRLGDPEGRVSYIAFADPYVSGCANPLARFD